MNKISSIITLVILGIIFSSVLTVIGFLISAFMIIGLPLRGLDTAWTLGSAVIVAFISIFFGGLTGLVVGGLKVNIPKAILISIFISLFHSTAAMFYFMQISNIPVRNSFLLSAIIVGLISYTIVGIVTTAIKNKFFLEIK